MNLERSGVLAHSRAEVTFNFLAEMCLDVIFHVIFSSLNFFANIALENMKSIGVKYFGHQAVI